jgi:uncharacterized membrane protein
MLDWLHGFWLTRVYHSLSGSFWFIPSLMAVATIIVAAFLVDTELSLDKPLSESTALQKAISIDSARSILSTIAGAIITVISLVFSMTLVALTLVSQQLGPRILQQFMNDRVTQVVLGLFVSTFIFALIVQTRMDQAGGRVPSFAVLLTSFLAVVCLGAIVHFIHHIARRIQADVIVAELGRALNASCRTRVERGHEHGTKPATFADEDEARKLLEQFEADEILEIAAPRSGYLNLVDEQALAAVAEKNGLLVRIDVPIGSFCLKGTPVFSVVSGSDDLDSDLRRQLGELVTLDAQRTAESSVEFNLNALVEIALRALSPGINDPFTAMTCIDRLTDSLRILLDMKSGLRVVRQMEEVRVIYAPRDYDQYLAMAFSPIRQAGARDAQVLLHLSKSLTALKRLAPKPYRAYIDRARDELRSSAELGQIAAVDRDDVIERLPQKKTAPAKAEAVK